MDLNKIKDDFKSVCHKYDYVTVEGSGGIICPIRWDNSEHILLEDIIKTLELNTIIIADSGLGTINATVLTTEYLKSKNIGIKGIILNHYTGNHMQKNNMDMIQELTGVPVIECVAPNDKNINISKKSGDVPVNESSRIPANRHIIIGTSIDNASCVTSDRAFIIFLSIIYLLATKFTKRFIYCL